MRKTKEQLKQMAKAKLPKKSPVPKPPSKPKCECIGMCPIFNKHEADLDHSSELAFLVRWLQAHKEYLKTYPPAHHNYFSVVQNCIIRNYPAIDCAKAEYDDFVAKMRHGKVKEPPYQNPFAKKENPDV